MRTDSLADTLARRIRAMVQSGEYSEGDRLPAILELARQFGVGPPTVREALKKLETLGVVDVRHGVGVYVASRRELMVLARPQIQGAVNSAMLLDLIAARIPLEVSVVEAAAVRISDDELDAMRHLLESVNDVVDDHRLIAADAAFHRQLAAVSGNTIMAQMLDALRDLLTGDGQAETREPLLCDADREAHWQILDCLEQRDTAGAAHAMRQHLEVVRVAALTAREQQRTA